VTTSNAKFQAFLSESRNESMDQHMLCVVDVPLYAMVPDTQRKRRLHQYSRGNTHVVQVDLRAGPSRYSRPLTHIMAFCLAERSQHLLPLVSVWEDARPDAERGTRTLR
jgi:hypothetical protein